MLLGMIIGAVIVGGAWGANELRWTWKLNNQLGENQDLPADDDYKGKHRV